jgi:hypothetical protein
MALIKLNNRSVKDATAFGSITGLGSMTFIKKLTASSSSTLSFVDGASSVVLDNTYKEYLFTFKNIHPSIDNAEFGFNLSVDSGSNYNVTKTSSGFVAYHNESGSDAALGYDAQMDLAQSTGLQLLTRDLGNDNDQNASGYLHLFNPSSTTFVKHYLGVCNEAQLQDYIQTYHIAGYGNTTSAVDAVQFKMSSGNIDAGDICLYGLS